MKKTFSDFLPGLVCCLMVTGLFLRCGWTAVRGLRLGVIGDLGRANHRIVSRAGDPFSYWSAEAFNLVLAAIGLAALIALTVAFLQSARSGRGEPPGEGDAGD